MRKIQPFPDPFFSVASSSESDISDSETLKNVAGQPEREKTDSKSLYASALSIMSMSMSMSMGTDDY